MIRPRLAGYLVAVMTLGAGCSGLPFLQGLGGQSGPNGQVSPFQQQRADGSIVGIVLTQQGSPASGVRVSAYPADAPPSDLMGNTGAALGGSAGNLLGNTGAALRYRTLALAAVTDAGGRFVLNPDATGTFNVEAVESADSKAWRAAFKVESLKDVKDAGTLMLGPTGSITGAVRSIDLAVTEFANTTIYIPGSSYLAVTGPDGKYTISSVPVGRFPLRAYHADLGDAVIPDTINTSLIPVEAQRASVAPDLVLKTTPPSLTYITVAQSDEITDNAAIGATIDLHGTGFGHKAGRRLAVNFSGGIADAPVRVSDELIRVKVPALANGTVNVAVAGMQSNPLLFRVLAGYSPCFGEFTVRRGAPYDLSRLVLATDAANESIAMSAVRGTRRSNLVWSVESGPATVSAAGVVTGTADGHVKVKAQAGLLPFITFLLSMRPPEEPVSAPEEGCGSPAPAIKTLIAGSGAPGDPTMKDGDGETARFYMPSGIAVDAFGVVWVADTLNHRIRRLEKVADKQYYKVSTYAGSWGTDRKSGLRVPEGSDRQGNGSFGMPHGLVVDPANGDLFLVDREWNSSTGPVSTYLRWITPTQIGNVTTSSLGATIRHLSGLAMDTAGTLYVGDTGNNVVRRITREGTISTLAGTGQAGWRDHAVATSGQFNYPTGVAVDAAGNVYVSDAGNNVIRRVSSTGVLTTLAGKAGKLGFKDGKGEEALFKNPMGMALDPDTGNLFVVDTDNLALRMVRPDGTVQTIISDINLPDLEPGYPAGVARDKFGNLYVTTSQNVIWKIQP